VSCVLRESGDRRRRVPVRSTRMAALGCPHPVVECPRLAGCHPIFGHHRRTHPFDPKLHIANDRFAAEATHRSILRQSENRNRNARLDVSKSVLCQRRVVKPEVNLLHMCRLQALRTFHRTERSRRLFQGRLETRLTQDPTASERRSESPMACGPTAPSRSTKDAARRRLLRVARCLPVNAEHAIPGEV
jgi:hypothetical protein